MRDANINQDRLRFGGQPCRGGPERQHDVDHDRGNQRQRQQSGRERSAPVAALAPQKPQVGRAERAGAEQVGRMDAGGGHGCGDGGIRSSPQEESDREQQQRAEAARLEHGAEQPLTGHTAIEEIVPLRPEQERQSIPQCGGVHQDQPGQEEAAGGAPAQVEKVDGDVGQAEEVDAEDGQIDGVEGGRCQEAVDRFHQETEKRDRVDRVGQPVARQVSDPGSGGAMQEVLVLVGGVQRRLAVGQAEEQGPEQRLEQAAQPRSGHFARDGGGIHPPHYPRIRGRRWWPETVAGAQPGRMLSCHTPWGLCVSGSDPHRRA